MLFLRLLGGPSLCDKGSTLTGPATHRHRLALLALLASSQSRPQSRDKLVAWLWPERDVEHARNLLNQGVHALRRAIGEAGIISVQDELRLDPAAVACDLVVFEDAIAAGELERAIGLYTGPFLDGFHLPGASEFEHWADGERDRLRRSYARSLESLAEAAEERREWSSAVERWRGLVAEEPYNARVTLRLMRALDGAGDRAGALQQARLHTLLLQQEFEAGPDPDVVALADRLRVFANRGARGSRVEPFPGEDVIRPVAQRVDVPVPSPPALEAPSLALVGRTAEWECLTRAWLAGQRGPPRCLLVSGVAGIGKTRLVEEFVRWADGQTAATATSRCYGTVGRLPYAPLASWLRSPALRHSLAALPQVWRAELAGLLPEVGIQPSEAGSRQDVPQVEARRRFFEAMVRAIAEAPQPLLLFIDDIQWADRDTLEWIRYFLRSEEPLWVLVVATLRLGEVPLEDRLDSVLLDLRRDGRLEEIPLEALDVADTAALGAAVAGAPLDPAAARALHRETEGHPLYIVEMMRSKAAAVDDAVPSIEASARRASTGSGARQSLPQRVLATIEARLAQLSSACRMVVGVAAVIGREFRMDLLAEGSGIGEDEAASALDELLERRLVREQSDGSYDFSHANIREVAYAGLSSARRRLLHQRIARALIASAAGSTGSAAAIAQHLHHGGLIEEAVPYYARAAEVASRIYAYEEAIGHLNQALALLGTLPESADRDRRELALQIALGPPLRESRGWAAPEMGEMAARAWKLSERVGTQPQRLRVMLELVSFRIARGTGLHEALETAEGALQLALAQKDPSLLAPAYQLVGEIHCQMGEFTRAREYLEQAAELYDRRDHATHTRLLGVDYGVLSPSFASHALWHLGYSEQALERSRQALGRAEELADPFSRAIALAYAATLQQFCGTRDAVEEQAAAAIAVSTEYGFPYYLAWGTILHGWAVAERGQVERGIAQMREGLAAMRATGCDYRRSYYLSLLAQVCGRAGQIDEGLDLLQEALTSAEASGEHWKDAELYRLRGELLAVSGAPTGEVRRMLQDAVEVASRQGATALVVRAERSLQRL
ncbi:MAG TPA: AAA family ATPase [Gemmatimonadales bacterium]|nr:AAA family ATPase [Gemmatimonadales bacterium]